MRYCILVLLLASTFANALPVGSPTFPKLIKKSFFIPYSSWAKARTGYEGDFVSDERMEQSGGGSGRVDDYKQETNSGTATLNLFDRLDIYGLLGSSRTGADWRFTSSGVTTRIVMQTKYRFLWGAGARGILYEWGCMTLGIGGRYSASHSNLSWMTVNGAPIRINGSSLHWREWQADLDLAYQIELFVPYVGIKYSNVRAKIGVLPVPISSDSSGILHMKNRTPVGVVIGCTLTTGKYFMLNIEGRLIDEEAITISGDLQF